MIKYISLVIGILFFTIQTSALEITPAEKSIKGGLGKVTLEFQNGEIHKDMITAQTVITIRKLLSTQEIKGDIQIVFETEKLLGNQKFQEKGYFLTENLKLDIQCIIQPTNQNGEISGEVLISINAEGHTVNIETKYLKRVEIAGL
jgi:hypothetical protein